MKLTQMALATALAAVWTALPPAVRAYEAKKGEKENVDVNRRGQHEDRGDEGGEREGMGGRDGRDGPRNQRDDDPVMNAKLEKLRGYEQKVREISKHLRDGSDAEKAAAKNEARKALGDLFDAKLAVETAMLERLEKHTAELKAKIARKQSSRDKAIETRLARMSGEGEDWD